MTRSTFYVPLALTQPAGIRFLHPDERVSRVELERRDARWRAKREAEHARSWAEDATLVGSVHSGGGGGGGGGGRSRRGRGGRGAGRRFSTRLRFNSIRTLFRH
ncbi:hypothetical protein IE53DRAFT_216204 [Violaceomyces palustris]|uniref:Uncharacterized protein n=1 Tax=Violaceomyces palustris TaxID=1673888 RepID=A0ACD0P8D7_9BASI|nr:hypothetical protein IE53DRAFT_216204 [Violaceomyces palustris]